jgi:hypothetical protein
VRRKHKWHSDAGGAARRLARGAAEVLLAEAEASGTAAMPPADAPLLRHRLRDGSYMSSWGSWSKDGTDEDGLAPGCAPSLVPCVSRMMMLGCGG